MAGLLRSGLALAAKRAARGDRAIGQAQFRQARSRYPGAAAGGYSARGEQAVGSSTPGDQIIVITPR